MFNLKKTCFLTFLMLCCCSFSKAQSKDTTNASQLTVVENSPIIVGVIDSTKIKKRIKDSTILAGHSPRIATKRSAILPGWGQAYNREYWKIPIVYGVLAIPTVAFIYNNNYYKKTKFAYEAMYKAQNGDSSDLAAIDPELVNLSMGSLQNYRNQFRRDRDYAILFFLLAWGLQVADATVFAHLKQFNVSNDLSMKINPTFNPYTRTPALTVSLNFRDQPKKRLALAR
jgi:hypothetical protein